MAFALVAGLIKEYIRLKMRSWLIDRLGVVTIKHFKQPPMVVDITDGTDSSTAISTTTGSSTGGAMMCEVSYTPPNTSRSYRIIFKKNRMNNIVGAYYNNADITDTILEYLGPGYNFYGIPTTPRMLGYVDGITIENRRGERKRYGCDDTIVV